MAPTDVIRLTPIGAALLQRAAARQRISLEEPIERRIFAVLVEDTAGNKISSRRIRLTELLDANSDDEHLCRWLRNAQACETTRVGGGVLPLTTIRRIQ